ncbi:yrdc domain-containing protein [Cystoisospora suis]|uniref:Threonylcarbamoyl-AMP synthase n=1 Tax=Cystoisospora suis TaxID=483139 RepID=A0A2C6KMK2_9APIC|nr:yrdc domain-containing protein [Cystoisospora suis]
MYTMAFSREVQPSSLCRISSSVYVEDPVVVVRAPPRRRGSGVRTLRETDREASSTCSLQSSSSFLSSSFLPLQLRPSSPSLLSLFSRSSLSSSPSFTTLSELHELSVHPIFQVLGAYIRQGGLVAFPTETVYGLGAAACIPSACHRVFSMKRRPPSDPLICHVVSVHQAFTQVFDLDLEEEEQGENAFFSHNSSHYSRVDSNQTYLNETWTEKASNGEVDKQVGSSQESVPQSISAGREDLLQKQKRQEKRDLRLIIGVLAEAFWPGPLSIVAKGRIREERDLLQTPHEDKKRNEEQERRDGGKGWRGVAMGVTAGTGQVAVRCPNHPYALALIAASRVPIAAPSANRFGRISPTSARHVLKQFADKERKEKKDEEEEKKREEKETEDEKKKNKKRKTEVCRDEGIEIDKKKRDNTCSREEREKKEDDSSSSSLLLKRMISEQPEGDELVLLDGDEEEEEIDGGVPSCCVGIESTVAKILPLSSCPPPSSSSHKREYAVQILRRGVVSPEMIREALDEAEKRFYHSRQAPNADIGEGEEKKERETSSISSQLFRQISSFPTVSVTVSEKLQYHLKVFSSSALGISKKRSERDEGTPSIDRGGEAASLARECDSRAAAAGATSPVGELERASVDCQSSVACTIDSCDIQVTREREEDQGGRGEDRVMKKENERPIVQDRSSMKQGNPSTETEEARNEEDTIDMNEKKMKRVSHVDDLYKTPMESPGLAITHYAPCIPCMLIHIPPELENLLSLLKETLKVPNIREESSLHKKDGTDSRLSASYLSQGHKERQEQDSSSSTCDGESMKAATIKACASPHPDRLELSSIILIDADESFHILQPFLLGYFSLLSSSSPSGNDNYVQSEDEGDEKEEEEACRMGRQFSSSKDMDDEEEEEHVADAEDPYRQDEGKKDGSEEHQEEKEEEKILSPMKTARKQSKKMTAKNRRIDPHHGEPQKEEEEEETRDHSKGSENASVQEEEKERTPEQEKGMDYKRKRKRHRASQDVSKRCLPSLAARNVFSTLHKAEELGLQRHAKAILIHAAPLVLRSEEAKSQEHGLAVFDRLYRSASGKLAELHVDSKQDKSLLSMRNIDVASSSILSQSKELIQSLYFRPVEV